MIATALPAWPLLVAGPGDDDDDDDEAPIGDPPDDDEDVDDEDDDDDEEPLQAAFLHRSIAIGATARHNVARVGSRLPSRLLIPDT